MKDKLTANRIKKSHRKSRTNRSDWPPKPDGDALGSLTALAEVLQIWQKPYHLFCAALGAAKSNWLPILKKSRLIRKS
jgi:hypothetical protein